jgi:hypothetical protein
MNKIKLLIIVMLVILLGCKQEPTKNRYKLDPIQFSDIKIAEIKKKLSDTLAVQLNAKQIKTFVKLINTSGHAKLLKAGPKFWLEVQLKNDSIRSFKIIDGYFGYYDTYYELKDKDYFKRIYENSPKSRRLIKNVIQ